MSGTDDEKDLIERSCQGDTRAFEAIYRRHGDSVFGIAWRLTLDRTRAEDLTQEVFVHLWRQLPSFRFESALSTWIHRVATNVVLAQLRRAGLALVDATDGQPVEGSAADAGQQRLEIEGQLAQLPERARIVLVLHDLVGMTHEEIAQQLDIAPGTSKAQLFRARKLYRELEATP